MQEDKTNNTFTYFLISILVLLPFALVPYFFNPLILSKSILLTIAAFGSAFTLLFSLIRRKQLSVHITPVFWPMLLFGAAVLISSLTNQQYPDKQLLGMGGTLLMLSTVVLLVPSIINGDHSRRIMQAVNWSAALLGLSSIAQVLGFGLGPVIEKISILSVPNSLAFSLAGSALVSVQLFSTIIIANVLDRKVWHKSWTNRILMLIIAIALGINLRAILPGGQAVAQGLPFGASVEIAKNSLYVTKTAFFGYGPDSYSNAYNILKPMWLNNAAYWQSSFETAFNLPLTFLVSLGAIGCGLWIWLLYRIVISAWRSQLEYDFLKYLLIGLIVWQLFSPAGPVFLGFLFILTSFLLIADTKQNKIKNFNFSFFNQQGEKHQLANRLLTGSTMLIAGLITFLLVGISRYFIAANYIYQANVAFSNQDVAGAYAKWQQATQIAPRFDFIRRSYALVNLDIAIAMSNKTDATPAEQEQIAQLVNQAIREAKAATVLDPNNYQNWLVLAQIYTQLIDSAEQASQEAFNALASAVSLNPNDPILRLNLGQLFVKLEKPNDALTFFSQAIERKPDLAQAHYLLAQTLKQGQNYQDAEKSLITVLSLVEQDSQDYATVEKELQELRDLIEQQDSQEKQQGQQTESSLPTETSLTSPIEQQLNLTQSLDASQASEIIRDGALATDSELINPEN
jgi:cytochrome c-type biogenesis protein CcmH/NrfG